MTFGHRTSNIQISSNYSLGQHDVDNKQLTLATSFDYILSKVLRYTHTSCPSGAPRELKSCFNCKYELTIEGNFVMWGICVLVPLKYRNKVLCELHQDLPGISQMKAIVRSHVDGQD